MNPNYKVPIIPENLSKHETIVQIAEVLDHLTNITEGIFYQVQKRLESNKNKLSDISSRAESVQRKVNNLKGAKKATQVFSSSKYPATDVYREYVSIFSDTPPVELKRHKVKPKAISTAYSPLDKLQFFHVNISSSKKDKLEGLGDIPEDLSCVNDLLLYNTGKNLYKNFVIVDALKEPQSIKEEDEIDISNIGPAPYSISDRSTVKKSVTKNYFYSPQIGEVPALDVPLDLPDLPGIADDLHYESAMEPGIAPSAVFIQTNMENIIDLPAVVQNEGESKEEDIPNVVLPPPPPPLEVQKPHSPVKETVKTQSEEVKVELPKPPEPEINAPKQDFVQQTNARSNLMEAIRQAGGKGKANLRSVHQETTKTTSNSDGDLMADLRSKLLDRRKGISGKKNVENVDPESTLGKISAMIPPPEPTNDVESTSNDEEDWA
ncbi:hypothetical protein NQ317_018702 [Molorchus minor]|uniref:WH2 domain-containing protein n=1 Tax=Molorchus minor TaxID=1323400 RepID=A0ABQ9JQP3_9CUCU|nr:hypothetical protein NQ317_018702 [Molorchus minor]